MDAIYNELVRAGIRLEAHGETLRAYHRGRALPDRIRRLIRQNKGQLLELTRRRGDVGAPEALGSAPPLEGSYAAACRYAPTMLICCDAEGVPIQEQDYVGCPDGAMGRVLQRFCSRVTVHVAGEDRVRMYEPGEVAVTAPF